MEETNMNKKKLLALLMALVMTLTLVPVTALAEVADSPSDNAVARVGQTYYTNLQEAINAAFNGGTVEVLKDVTVEYWHQNVWSYYEGGKLDLSTDAPDYVRSPLVGPNGLTINGNGHTVTINHIDSGTNGDSIFARAENTIINNITFDIQATVDAPSQDGKYGIGMKSGALNGVTIKTVHGAPLSIYYNCANTSDYNSNVQGVTVTNCVLDAGDGRPIYTWERTDANPYYYANLIVRNSTLKTTNEGTILILRSNDVIENCKIDSPSGSKITLTNDGIGVPATITGNDFGVTGLKVYSSNHAAEATITRNVFSSTSAIKRSGEALVDLSGNYWGGSEPSFSEDMYVTYNNWYTGTQARESAPGAEREVTNLVNSAAANVARIGAVEYPTLEAAIAVANADTTATAENPVVVNLLKDTSISATIGITNHVTLDGNGKTITAENAETAVTRGIWIDKGNVTVSVKNLTIAGSKLERAIQVNSDKDNVTLTIDNVTATATMYTVNICGDVDNLTMNITNSNLTGWGAVNLWGHNGTVTISDSTLTGINDKGYNADGWNDFGTVVVEGDTTGQTDTHASAYNISISNTTISASQTTGNQQFALLYNNPSVNNAITLTGCSISLDDKCSFLYDNGFDSTTRIKTTYMEGTTTLPELPAGYTYVDVADDYKQVALHYVAQVGNVKYTSLEAAVAAAQTGDTINIIADFAIPETNTAESDRIIVNKSVTIDFGEYTMSVPGALGDDASNNWVGLYIQGNDVNVTLTGTTGGIDCLDNNDESGAYSFYVKDGATVTVNGGHYHGGGTVGQVAAGTLIINDGYFKVTDYSGDYSGYRYVLNCVDAYYTNGTATITVKGGTFEHFDPSNCLAEGANTNFVADGYEAVALTGENEGKWQVGKVKATGLTLDTTAQNDNTTATYTATKSVVDEQTNANLLEKPETSFSVTVTAPTENLGSGKESIQLSNININEVVAAAVDKADEQSETNASVVVQLAKDESAQVVVTETTKKVTFEVHPEAIITVTKTDEDDVVTTLPLSNDQIKGAFRFKLTIPTDLATVGEKVTVIHKHSDNTEENLGAFTVADDHTITLTGISSFSEFIATSVSEGDVTVGAVGASLRRRVLTSDHTTVVNTSTDYRVTFDWTDTESKVNVSESYLEWSNNDGATWHEVSIANSAALDGGVTRASVVITGIPRAAFGTTIKTRIHLATSGEAIVAYGPDYSVNVVADKLSKLTGNETWSEYGRYLLGTRTEPLYVNN
jgi:hypothetical protein